MEESMKKLGKITAVLLCFILLSTSFGNPAIAASAWLEWTETGNYYNYCPSYIANSDTERFMYYCKNQTAGQIVDYIYMRRITGSGSSWTWGTPSVALAPSATGWDSVHVCDPDVKKGSFLFNNHTYSYAMFYLGCDQLDNNHNQIGVAFSDSLYGPWVKWSGNPLITFTSTSQWGVGQPSATSVDGKGRMLLFYSRGDSAGTRMVRRDINLANMSSPTIGGEVTVPTNGLTESDGSSVILHNGALAYDAATDRFYLVRPRHPFETTDPSYVSSSLQVAYTSGATIWNGTGTWTIEGHIKPAQSGKARNHNSTLLTDVWGNLKGGANSYQVNFTGSDVGSFPGNLWTYRIYGIGKASLVP
jgi:hypothetical protein